MRLAAFILAQDAFQIVHDRALAFDLIAEGVGRPACESELRLVHGHASAAEQVRHFQIAHELPRDRPFCQGAGHALAIDGQSLAAVLQFQAQQLAVAWDGILFRDAAEGMLGVR